ncbi:uncharacterized protein FOMMEDRAFT_32524 [Fomitiporia mediterranea MF3/22]|uniref:Uncharacterized protein n=1 Tax=Fomitiporia mediterranea (strain MF3/22) TaxID=694068 RepID=R7SF44_FOMME|nr:uncharacterized protein FOMMEDRAFT_32524 [Fomitiporia mediterranea MF3/22]EJC97323.1 hypothetical protein FOMMEDRAFT_32524 [Fomitiporia mediterranea MF3/22]
MPRLPSAQQIIAIYSDKECISIAANRATIRETRDSTGDNTHRGLEFIWYWTWDIVINKITWRYISLSKIPQPRITSVFVAQGGTGQERWKTCVPDFGIVRHLDEEVIEMDGEEIVFPAKSKLVAIGEIKPAPSDDSVAMIKHAITEATMTLSKQARTFFRAYPKRKAIVGISVAGEYWSFQTLHSKNFKDNANIDEPNPDYLPSNPSSSVSPAPMSISDQSSPDPLDFLSPGKAIEHPIYRLRTTNSNTVMDQLVDAIRKLEAVEGSKEFDYMPL